jgi:hypothetical protein
VKSALSNTTLQVGDKVVNMETGVPQGAITSPLLFNIFLDPLLHLLGQDSYIEPLAFADDLVTVCKGIAACERAIETVLKFGEDNNMTLNRDKCAILFVRKTISHKTKHGPVIKGIKVVEKYKYLGVIIDDCCRLDEESTKKKSKEK